MACGRPVVQRTAFLIKVGRMSADGGALFPVLPSPLRWPQPKALLRHRSRQLLFALWMALVVGSAVALAVAQHQSTQQIESRFQARATTNTRFVETYVGELATQERRVAARELADASVSRA